MYTYIRCDDKFDDCKKLFSWLGQKVNKRIDAYGHDADKDMCTDDAASRHINTVQYSHRILFSICVRNFREIRIEGNPNLSHL